MKSRHSLQVISGTFLAVQVTSTALVSATSPQSDQKIEGINQENSKVGNNLKYTLVTIIAATGVGLLFLILWILVRKYVASRNLEIVFSYYENFKFNLSARKQDIDVLSSKIKKLINDMLIIAKDPSEKDEGALAAQEEMNKKKKNEEFLKLLELNKDGLKKLDFDLENFKNREGFKVENTLVLFKERMAVANLINGSYISMKLLKIFRKLKKNHIEFSNEGIDTDFGKAFAEYLLNEDKGIFNIVKEEEIKKDIEECEKEFKEIKTIYLNVWCSTIEPALIEAEKFCQENGTFKTKNEKILEKENQLKKYLKKTRRPSSFLTIFFKKLSILKSSNFFKLLFLAKNVPAYAKNKFTSQNFFTNLFYR